MSRVVNTDSIGKQRNQLVRTAAELLRHLTQKAQTGQIDAEAKDMFAALVLTLKEIEANVEEAMIAWEKRNYWNKVEEFRSQWIWAGMSAAQLEMLIRADQWEQLPAQLMPLFKHFAEINITRFTRTAETWQGAYDKLIQTPSPAR